MTAVARSVAAVHPRPTIPRRIGAVLAGLLTIVILSTATDAVLHATGIFPPPRQPMSDGLFALATAYRVVYGVAAGYVTARLAPDRPLRHALALGWIGVGISVAGAAAMWAYGPAWYSLIVIAIALPCAWAGGRLFEARSGRVQEQRGAPWRSSQAS